MRDPFVHIPDPTAVQATPKVQPLRVAPSLRSSGYWDTWFDYSSTLMIPGVRTGDLLIAILEQDQNSYGDVMSPVNLNPGSGWAKVAEVTLPRLDENSVEPNDPVDLQIYSQVVQNPNQSFTPFPGGFHDSVPWSCAGAVLAFADASVVKEFATASVSSAAIFPTPPRVAGAASTDIILNIVAVPSNYSPIYESNRTSGNEQFVSIPPGFDSTANPPGLAPNFTNQGIYAEGFVGGARALETYEAMSAWPISTDFSGPQLPAAYVNTGVLFAGPSAAPGSLGVLRYPDFAGPYNWIAATLLIS